MSELKLRVQLGRHKGRVIKSCGDSVRPSMGWTREVIFNWLGNNLRKKRVLDACSGSGILSFEALSLGAESSVCIDHDALLLDNMALNAKLLDVKVQLVKHEWPNEWKAPHAFDVIFWDPPYSAPWRYDVFHMIQAMGWLRPGGYLCIESASDDVYQDERYTLLKSKKRAHSKIQLWQERS